MKSFLPSFENFNKLLAMRFLYAFLLCFATGSKLSINYSVVSANISAFCKCNYNSFFFKFLAVWARRSIHYPWLSITFCCTVVANLGRQVGLACSVPPVSPLPLLLSSPWCMSSFQSLRFSLLVTV